MDKILILDFGSQSTQLIGRRIRDMGVYTEIIPGDSSLAGSGLAEALGGGGLSRVKGIILSGAPEAADSGEGELPDPALYSSGLPLLGICYGAERIIRDNGLPREKFPRAEGCGKDHPVPAIDAAKRWYGLDFHPELPDCERGKEILENFVFGIAGSLAGWSMERYIEEVRASLAEKAASDPVLLLISGGVDSTVTAALLLKTLNADQIHLMYVDTGLMRKDETKAVKANLERLGAKHLHIVYAEDEFLAALKGHADPEEKRTIIGDLFITIQEREVARLGLGASCFLAQGTIYPDLIESGKGGGKKLRLIKSHHNVGSPLVDAKRRAGLLIEPLDRLFKDEVRRLGRVLGLDGEIVSRHPFPGPGIAVRILGEVTKEKCDILREADAIYIEELKKRRAPSGERSLYDDIWQAFPVLLPVRSVGVVKDVRRYGWVVALRAIVSTDGMTAAVYPFPMKDLLEISGRITGEIEDIGRVTYDISGKPPATIEWE